MSTQELGVNAVSRELQMILRQYIEAQYHIRNDSVIAERRALLDEPEMIHQKPYVESTPVYKLGRHYSELNIPSEVERSLTSLVNLKVGIFARPYEHQANALEAFFRGDDLVVSTGTGSGKTESFLMPIIGSLAVEASERPLTSTMFGCRALLLYPMNALVNDQLSRIRLIFGTEEAARIISSGRDRLVRFATYTGRTPYPGTRKAGRDTAEIKPIFEEYYLKLLEQSPQIVEELTSRGKWPCKDLERFYARELVEQKKTKTGKAYSAYHWTERLVTDLGDRELMTRHEVQATCPDLLITNYSMLEYMLMRPIERSIFTQTREWLRADSRNVFTLVIDEAHLYYGASGAEVALLIRRLMSRLEIPRERVRCILTSASLGSAEPEAVQFARDLTGLRSDSTRRFSMVVGHLEPRPASSPADVRTAVALAAVLLDVVEGFSTDLQAASREVTKLAQALGWAGLQQQANSLEFREYLFNQLSGFEPFELLLDLTSGKAIALEELGERLFPDADSITRRAATAALLSLATVAQRQSDQRVLLPTRLHLFFRGLPGLFGCSNAQCDARRYDHKSPLLGRLFTDQRISCICSAKARVYELYTHRDCGAAFLQGYVESARGSFLWNEPSRQIGETGLMPISRIELLVDGPPHPLFASFTQPLWLDYTSGRLQWAEPEDAEGFTKLWAPGKIHPDPEGAFAFEKCPICLRQWRLNATKIMDHETKGEAPFAALIAEELELQPAQGRETELKPNAGRKVLLFSDGRQKAARLARDIPREVENDVFRVAIAVAARNLAELGFEASPNNMLYTSFLSVLATNNLLLFDGTERNDLQRDVKSYRSDFDGDLRGALSAGSLAFDLKPPRAYYRHLLRQLCGSFYSLRDATIGFVEPSKPELGRLANEKVLEGLELTRDDIRALAIAWIGSCLDTYSIDDSQISDDVRRDAAGFPKPNWGGSGKFDRDFSESMNAELGLSSDSVERVETALRSLSREKEGDGIYLAPRKLKVTIDLISPWYQCSVCTRIAPVALRARCIFCLSSHLVELNPSTSRYLEARKGYWRDPVVAAFGGKRLKNVAVEEHTAQLSHRDRTSVHATTEQHELRFQDFLLPGELPIDVLSCTTTMEVGVDIGPLLAVGLRNVPPQRSNYQQRAGRVGRRSAAVSTVVTYAQNSPHDSFYFRRPSDIIAGTPPTPKIKVDNPKIAKRHLNSYLLQSFFNEAMDSGHLASATISSRIEQSLGGTSEFFHNEDPDGIGLAGFAAWTTRRVLLSDSDLLSVVLRWLPESLKVGSKTRPDWIRDNARGLIDSLYLLKLEVPLAAADGEKQALDEDLEREVEERDHKALLLDFLFEQNLLPTYAFPTNLASFLIERYKKNENYFDVTVKEMPQQSIDKALSEYAPGRLVVINKDTYRSGGVAASVLPQVVDRAVPLFERKKELIYCSRCTFVQEAAVGSEEFCPVCNGSLESHLTIQPEVFLPEHAAAVNDNERDQEITYATMAQLPVPVGEDLGVFQKLGPHVESTYTQDKRLITVNKGRKQKDSYSGFVVCTLCGAAGIDDDLPTPHERPYLVAAQAGKTKRKCSGRTENVYLGGTFKTDVLLLRFPVGLPLVMNTSDARERYIIESALHTASEAVSMAAVRHRELDIDPRELGSGFRIIPADANDRRLLDIYIYDTSSGGAGYSEIAGQNIEEILNNAIDLLESCPNRCERSCQECLRQYSNQHIQQRLDRKLGASFLRYSLLGEIPERLEVAGQAEQLRSVTRYLTLEGHDCQSVATLNGVSIPLLVSSKGEQVAVGTRPALLHESAVALQDWELQASDAGIASMTFPDFDVSRNVPDVQRRITSCLTAHAIGR